jgi:hypothetical protein
LKKPICFYSSQATSDKSYLKGEICSVLPGSENLARLMKKYIDGTVEVLQGLTGEQYANSSEGTSKTSGSLARSPTGS